MTIRIRTGCALVILASVILSRPVGNCQAHDMALTGAGTVAFNNPDASHEISLQETPAHSRFQRETDALNKLIARYSDQQIIGLDIGETHSFRLQNGTERAIRLVSAGEIRDSVIGLVRRADVDVEIDGRQGPPVASSRRPTLVRGHPGRRGLVVGVRPSGFRFGDGTVIPHYASYSEVTHSFETPGIHIVTATATISGIPVSECQKVIVETSDRDRGSNNEVSESESPDSADRLQSRRDTGDRRSEADDVLSAMEATLRNEMSGRSPDHIFLDAALMLLNAPAGDPDAFDILKGIASRSWKRLPNESVRQFLDRLSREASQRTDQTAVKLRESRRKCERLTGRDWPFAWQCHGDAWLDLCELMLPTAAGEPTGDRWRDAADEHAGVRRVYRIAHLISYGQAENAVLDYDFVRPLVDKQRPWHEQISWNSRRDSALRWRSTGGIDRSAGAG